MNERDVGLEISTAALQPFFFLLLLFLTGPRLKFTLGDESQRHEAHLRAQRYHNIDPVRFMLITALGRIEHASLTRVVKTCKRLNCT